MTALAPRRLGLSICAAALVLMFPVAAPAGTLPEEPPVPPVLPATEEEAGKILAAIGKAKADKDDALMAAALLETEKLKDDRFVEHIREGLESKDDRVLTWAIRGAASHELEDVSKSIRKLLGSKKKKRKKKDGGGGARGPVMAAAIDYLSRMAIEGEEERVLDDHLKRLFINESHMKASWAKDKLRASIHYLGKMKYPQSVPTLVALIKEPYPENPNSPTNPPASYWEARYKLWQASESWVRWALKEITGKEFRTHREWQAYAKKNKKKFK